MTCKNPYTLGKKIRWSFKHELFYQRTMLQKGGSLSIIGNSYTPKNYSRVQEGRSSSHGSDVDFLRESGFEAGSNKVTLSDINKGNMNSGNEKVGTAFIQNARRQVDNARNAVEQRVNVIGKLDAYSTQIGEGKTLDSTQLGQLNRLGINTDSDNDLQSGIETKKEALAGEVEYITSQLNNILNKISS